MTKAVTLDRPSPTTPMRRFTYPTQAKFVSQAALLEEAGPPQVPALACFLGFGLVCTAIVASMLIEIDVLSSNMGRIVPSSANHVLQSFDGGIVDQIDVEEGQIVDVGDRLVTLHDPEAKAQLRRLQARQASLGAQAQRLRSLADLNSDLLFADLSEVNVNRTEQMAILPLEEAAAASERALARAEIGRRMQSLASLRSLSSRAASKLALAEEKLTTQRILYHKQLVSKSVFMGFQREVADAQLEVTEIEGQINEAEAGLFEAQRRLDDIVAARRQRQGDRLSAIMADLSELQQQIIAIRERTERGVITAPVQGVIQELAVRNSGQVVAPGEMLLELVPIDSEMIVEVRLPTTDISHVHEGQDVRITIDGMEPYRHGYLEGSVKRLSPSTFVDENGLPYYRAVIALASNQLAGRPLIPGMTVRAQIKTGQRTMLEYLLKPIYRAWSNAFREQ